MQAAKAGMRVLPGIFEPAKTTEWRVLLFGPNPNRTLLRVIVWSLVVIGFFHNLLVPIQIIGSSMWPTYQSGSLNFVQKWSYSKAPPLRGDVIALHAEGELLLKRIVALPGETVSIWDGEIRINDTALEDQFSRHRIPWEMDPIMLSQEEYFVIGDNRSASVFCKVHKSQILGKVLF